MLTKYLTGVTTAFSPFNAHSGKIIRSFLALLPPNARSTMAIDVKMFGQSEAQKPAMLTLKFMLEDGKEMQVDVEKMKLTDIEIEVDRHSRMLKRKDELSG
ncbi:hypothetical protein B0A55_00963 [Friedmanniomyces simplex]|uniref:Large ribosomal subunit protein mL53 n=1 Tax=Friedmanniomyces simplex TaxID=329884 RepID=A0A4U0Y195_9PEZI|nr:hypothetical protein B0A55_00963 [Friedmanniomyces simplex]